jgi:transposase
METLAMSERERRRLEVFSRVGRGELTLRKASELLKLSYRQTKRSYGRYRAEGDGGVVHRLRGRASNRGTDEEKKARVLKLYQEKYWDFGPTLAVEYLAREDGEVVGVETLRGWLKGAGLWQPRRRRPEHRRWRARREHCGELVQLDGSHHDWFEGRRAWAVLMVLIDDATNRTYARFFEGETTEASFETFRRYVERYGLPHAVYPDKAGIYRTTRDATVDETLANEPPATQFGRAMRELGVELILANSPQAKGRVERRNAVFQDRLVKAMRLKNLSDLESANAYLEEEFLDELNAKFKFLPTQPADLHRRVPRGVKLERILAFQEERVVQKDWTIRWRNRWFQLTESNRKLSLVNRKVTVCEQLDGTIVLLFGKREVAWEELPERPAKVRAVKPPQTGCGGRKKPAADHRFRRPFKPPQGASSASAARMTGG